jgi:hypothetical protein
MCTVFLPVLAVMPAIGTGRAVFRSSFGCCLLPLRVGVGRMVAAVQVGGFGWSGSGGLAVGGL